ncbi:DUF1186 domain-containing protein [Siccirubricoccus sp. G192]|uniref:DUF1186 domain-containing protein n=1 Tax=Siccirubricoccus sp. G192 TaxID=2849651 RepID=UPI001C2C5F9B|nr:DUF1186 domain-containing protein [Siccirubricoccus sp. G192]MBV1797595.1 DUF1186 domain-containing protein [Siccirubricoccus sp. G192]
MDDILRVLAQAGNDLPREAMRQALQNWDEAAPPLLALLDAYAEGRDRSEEAAAAVFFILHLAAQAREGRAFPALCRLAMDAEALEQTLGDGTTESLAQILIGTFDGELDRLKAVIEQEAADEFARAAAFDALTWLTATGAVPRVATAAYLQGLHRSMRPQATSFAWFGWQRAVALLGLDGLSPLVEDAFGHRFIDPTIMGFEDFLKDLAAAKASTDPAAFLATQRISPIEDAIAELSGWYGFSDEFKRDQARRGTRSATTEDWTVPQPVVNPFRGVGRNDPCPCGSGKKFKKCCMP